jgi:uroporphyrinogen III methyltransferase/synthase
MPEGAAGPQPEGVVYLVGAGPGDPGLITLRGVDCLGRADVVVVDRLVDPALRRHAREGAEVLYVGKESSRHTLPQEQINEMLVGLAREGKTVVRLKGGDPFVFGRGGEEAAALAEAGVRFEVVPGVTSAVAAPAYAGIPVTHRGLSSSVAIVTGHEDPAKAESSVDLARLARAADTLVFLMGMGRLKEIAAELVAHGRPPTTPVALVRWGATARQEVLIGSLADIAERAEAQGFGAPVVIVVGEVVRLREKLRWFDNRPLFGKRIVVTRSRAQASDLAALLAERGAEPIEFPVIRIAPPDDFGALDPAIERLGSYDWVIFASPNAVDALMTRCLQLGKDVRAWGRARLCAIGPATARRLQEMGLHVDLVPERFVAEGVVDAFAGVDVAGRRFLLPRSNIGRELVADLLTERGAHVEAVLAYQTLPDTGDAEDMRARLREGEIDAVTFTSSSTVRNFHAALGLDEEPALLDGVVIACIGPITAAAAGELGLTVDIVAEPPIPAFVEAIVQHYDAAGARPR